MTPAEASDRCEEICRLVPVIPVLVVESEDHAVPLAEALVAGGLAVLEVTLRTPSALAAIRAMSRVPGAVVGAGTLLSPDDVRAAREAGARFGVSPGATPRLLDACEANGLPLLPGAATATETMILLERGYRVQKFFPASSAGGVGALRAISGPLPQVGFCPTGGVSEANFTDYLALPNVLCVGGSWVAPRELVAAADWAGITERAKRAVEAAGMASRGSAQALP